MGRFTGATGGGMTVSFHAGALDDPLLRPGSDTVLWYVRLDSPTAEASARCASLLYADYCEFAKRPDAGMRGMRRRLSRHLIGKVTGLHPDAIVFVRAANGAPGLSVPDGWFISLAGTWPHCLIGLSRRPIGVDVEPADALPPPDDCLTPRELAQLGAGGPDRALFRWLAKEAHAKRFAVASEVDPCEIETLAVPGGYNVTSRHGASRCSMVIHGPVVIAVAF